ncbi:hypothetical protein [Lichenifustis flavocetrariae]|uniref:3-keto-disaccharide hydrolase domain-containing protein n=1 Tax=Lichenifustis flavocetrariae TaxID=2949735 RepID=A0AA42CNM7_9HYPH|nr:hypothetical protein [Lichenifustis flavocetrariae]MCW6509557.1 hypothetical protein [Lichenifustis flavocetrariae]
MSRWLQAVMVVGAVTLAGTPAFACKGGKTLFSDDFQEVDASWGLDAPDVMVEDGKVKVKPQPNISNLLIYKGLNFGEVDICLTVRMPKVVSNNDNTMAGPVFLQQDYDNYYMFMITPSGYAEIARKLNGKWVSIVDWKADADINTKAGSDNVLRVLVSGNTISAFVNDAKFASVKGQIPDGGGRIGMRAQSEENQVDTWKFSLLKVTDVPVDASAGAPPPPPATAGATKTDDTAKVTPAAPAAPATPATP